MRLRARIPIGRWGGGSGMTSRLTLRRGGVVARDHEHGKETLATLGGAAGFGDRRDLGGEHSAGQESPGAASTCGLGQRASRVSPIENRAGLEPSVHAEHVAGWAS